MRAAVSDVSENVELANFSGGDFLTSGASIIQDHKGKPNDIEVVPAVTIDEFLRQNSLAMPGLVKIDVEGFEKNVLLGLQKTLAKFRPSVLMEFSPSTRETFADVEEFHSLLPDDYRIETINPHNEVLGVFSRSSYRLIDFDFDRPGSGLNILLRPQGSNI